MKTLFKTKVLVGIAVMAMALTSCDDTTETIGSSLTDNMDNLEVSTDTFEVTTRSIVADSVLSRNNVGYLGIIKDPETGTYVTADFMAQFHSLEGFTFPEKENIVNHDADNEIIADSCEIKLYFKEFFGDSLANMKLTAYEMEHALQEGKQYYSNFDPEKEGLLRSGGLQKDLVYTLADKGESDSIKSSKNYTRSIRIRLNDLYTAKNGRTYNNYGTYVMKTYYEHPEYFKNTYSFINKVCPGFYFKMKSGVGSMATIFATQLNIYIRYHNTKKDSTYTVAATFTGTEEVLQATRISNDKKAIKALVEDNTCTYIKTPAGIFTEMTLPVDEIMKNHQNDTLNTAKMVLTRINNDNESKYNLHIPNYLLLVPKDSLYSFFENNRLHNNRTSYLIERDYTSTTSGTTTVKVFKNTYTLHNLSGLIRFMEEARAKGGSNYTAEHPNWNKVVLVPVNVSSHTITTNSQTSTSYDKISNDLSLSSTRFVGGSDNHHEKLKMSVIYSKFKGK